MLNFPNQSRFFDPTRRAVRFWGYDSAMEWSFFVSEDALQRIAAGYGAGRGGFAEGLRFQSALDLRGGVESVHARS